MTRKYQIYLQDIKKDLRPICLTPSVSKVAEEFVVKDFPRPTFLGVIEDNQYWVTKGSSTNIALINMLYHWSMWTDGNSSTVITVLSDHRKAFDFIDHGIVLQKLCKLDIQLSIINWVIDFHSNRSQRIKLAHGCFSIVGSSPLRGTSWDQIGLLGIYLIDRNGHCANITPP